jgi:DNA repair exonuclease SbcCD ATPase subunit
MTPLQLRITNFRSITKTLIFEFPESAGFYFLCGDNQAEPRLEANGTGKSTIWDALCWLCFNKTSRGLKAGDVCNWDIGKGCRVEFDYVYESVMYTVVRTWGPIAWSITSYAHDVDGVTEALAADDPGNLFYSHLKLGYVPFLNSILIAQSEPMFLDLKATDKSALFSQVMNLDVWTEYSQRASLEASKLDMVIRNKDSELSSLKGRVQALRESVDADDDMLRTWEQTHKQRLDEIEQEHAAVVARQNGYRNMRGGCITTREAGELIISKANTIIPDLLNAIRILNNERDGLIDTINTTKGTRSALVAQLDYLQDHDTCSKCLQDIDPRHKSKNVTELQAQITSLDDLVDVSNIRIAELSDEIEEKESSLRSKESEIEAARKKVHDASIELSSIDRDIKHADATLDALEKKMEATLLEKNPHEARRHEVLAKIEDTEAAIEQLVYALDGLITRHSMLSYWTKGFKDVRLYLIAESMQQLEIEVNSCLNQLGLSEWKILFDVDKETKSGSVQRGFDVKIISPHNETPVPWESWSGGESQRLRIATTMGLANLIKSSTGSQFNLEVWDEPTQHMSEQGVSDLLDSLAERSQNFNKQIWIVDHRSLGYGNFDAIRTIVKTENGTTLK